MRPPSDRVRTRILPAIVTALGITFLAAGLLSVTGQVTAVPDRSGSPDSAAVLPDASGSDASDGTVEPGTSDPGTLDPSASPSDGSPSPSSGDPSASGSPIPLITLPPIGSARPPTPVPVPGSRVASRVRVAALKIDLAVVKPPKGYPLCNVAMYYLNPALGQPGQGKSIYLFAHARTGMFLPLLTASKIQNGKKMVGMIVEVWTADDQRFLYVITDVYRHVAFDHVFDKPFAATNEALWLQTSEGVGPQPKLLIKAEPLSREPAPYSDAHPKAKPVNCS